MKIRSAVPGCRGYWVSAIAAFTVLFLLPAGVRAEDALAKALEAYSKLSPAQKAKFGQKTGARAGAAALPGGPAAPSHDSGGAAVSAPAGGTVSSITGAYVKRKLGTLYSVGGTGPSDAPALAPARSHEAGGASPAAAPAALPPPDGIKIYLLKRNTLQHATDGSAVGNYDPDVIALRSDTKDPFSFIDPVTKSLRLRANTDDLKVYEVTLDKANSDLAKDYATISNDKTQTKESDPATFSYSRDNVKHTDGWKAKGVLYLPMTLIDTNTIKPMSPFSPLAGTLFPFAKSSWMIFYPAVRFERDTSKDGTDSPVNKLDFLIGADFNFYDSPPNSTDQNRGEIPHFAYVIRAAAGVHTNFSLNDPEPLWELSFDPISDKTALNVFDYAKSSIFSMDSIMHKFILRGLTQSTTDHFQFSKPTVGNVTVDKDTFPLGFQAGLSFTPRKEKDTPTSGGGGSTLGLIFEDTKLTATYTGVYDTKHDNEYSGLFEATLELPVFKGDKSQAGWTITYKNGNDLSSHDRVDEIDIALSAKF